jgi:hypothetical protein
MSRIKEEYEKVLPMSTPEREENISTPPYLKMKDEFEKDLIQTIIVKCN